MLTASGSSMLKSFAKSAADGKVNDEDLRKMITEMGEGYVTEVLQAELITIDRCTACKQWCFSSNLRDAYSGAHTCCHKCIAAHYVECRDCECYVLKDDAGEFHTHVSDLIENRNLNQLANHDSDIMRAVGPIFKRTLDDNFGRQEPRYFGIELEVERRQDVPVPPDIHYKTRKLFAQDFVMPTWDGSLSALEGDRRGTGGFEIVTLPATIRYHKQEAGWLEFFETMQPFLQRDPQNTAGLHVHMSRKAVTLGVISKIVWFVNSSFNRKFMFDMANRNFLTRNPMTDLVYAQVRDEKGARDVEKFVRRRVAEITSKRVHDSGCPMGNKANREYTGYYRNPRTRKQLNDHFNHPIIQSLENSYMGGVPCTCKGIRYSNDITHYEALNINTKKDTFEMRIFKSSLVPLHFFAALEFCDALQDFAPEYRLLDMKFDIFLTWLDRRRKLYPNLAEWLVTKSYLEGRKPWKIGNVIR